MLSIGILVSGMRAAAIELPRTPGAMGALEAFEATLSDRYGLSDLKVDWSLGTTLARELAELEEPSVEPAQVLPAECPDRVVVRLQGRRAGRPVEVLVPGTLRVSGLGQKALRTLRAGSTLSEVDAERVQTFVPPSARCEVPIDGMFVTETVVAGAWIPCASLREPPLVRRGQDLVVVVRGPGLELRGRGVARKDAWLGEELSVRVGGAARDCHAQVIGPGTVEVAMAGREVSTP
ncbi:MAG: flagellar basal body P-ring formation chaperone FlgA [Candidatus Eisenbacteria bacterium]